MIIDSTLGKGPYILIIFQQQMMIVYIIAMIIIVKNQRLAVQPFSLHTVSRLSDMVVDLRNGYIMSVGYSSADSSLRSPWHKGKIQRGSRDHTTNNLSIKPISNDN